MYNGWKNDLATFTDTAVSLLGAAMDLKFIIPDLVSRLTNGLHRNHIRKSKPTKKKRGRGRGRNWGPQSSASLIYFDFLLLKKKIK